MRFLVLSAGVCGVASAALLARYGLDAHVSAVALSAWRLVVASAGLVLFQLIRKPQPKLERSDFWRVGLAGVFLAAHFATWIASLEYVSIARSTLLVATSPLWAGLLGLVVPALKPKPLFWVGLGIAAIGTVLVAAQDPGSTAQKGPPWVGDLLAVVGAICIIPYLLLSQDVQRRVGTVTTITWIYSAAAVSLLLCLVPLRELTISTNESVWLSIIGMAVFAQLIGHSALNFSLRHFSTAQVTTTTLLEPVFAALLAWVFLAEKISLLQAVGGAILLAGVAVSLQKGTAK
jgi:drug/metabolite transporter (DMT)-like permease